MNADKIIYSLGSGGGGGTVVEANPTLSGNEDALSSIGIGSEKYKVYNIPTITITLSQVIHPDPLRIQLTSTQYNVFANNKQVVIDLTNLGETTVIWHYIGEYDNVIEFGFNSAEVEPRYYLITIDRTTLEATYENGTQTIYPINVASGNNDDVNKLLAMDSSGDGKLTYNLPYITTAPSAANAEGGQILTVLTSDPATKYAGYIYFII